MHLLDISMYCGASSVCCSITFSFFFFFSYSLLRVCCVWLLYVFVYVYVSFSVLWAQLPELNNMNEWMNEYNWRKQATFRVECRGRFSCQNTSNTPVASSPHSLCQGWCRRTLLASYVTELNNLVNSCWHLFFFNFVRSLSFCQLLRYKNLKFCTTFTC